MIINLTEESYAWEDDLYIGRRKAICNALHIHTHPPPFEFRLGFCCRPLLFSQQQPTDLTPKVKVYANFSAPRPEPGKQNLCILQFYIQMFLFPAPQPPPPPWFGLPGQPYHTYLRLGAREYDNSTITNVCLGEKQEWSRKIVFMWLVDQAK